MSSPYSYFEVSLYNVLRISMGSLLIQPGGISRSFRIFLELVFLSKKLWHGLSCSSFIYLDLPYNFFLAINLL